MSNTKLSVRYSKYFISGSMKGISVDCEVSMANIDKANEYMRWCHEHAEIPAEDLIYSNIKYVIHNARIVTD